MGTRFSFFQRILVRIKKSLKGDFASDEESNLIESDENVADVLCPWCGSDYFEDIEDFFQENYFKVVSRCSNCGRYFVSEYCLIGVSGIDDFHGSERMKYPQRTKMRVAF